MIPSQNDQNAFNARFGGRNALISLQEVEEQKRIEVDLNLETHAETSVLNLASKRNITKKKVTSCSRNKSHFGKETRSLSNELPTSTLPDPANLMKERENMAKEKDWYIASSSESIDQKDEDDNVWENNSFNSDYDDEDKDRQDESSEKKFSAKIVNSLLSNQNTSVLLGTISPKTLEATFFSTFSFNIPPISTAVPHYNKNILLTQSASRIIPMFQLGSSLCSLLRLSEKAKKLVSNRSEIDIFLNLMTEYIKEERELVEKEKKTDKLLIALNFYLGLSKIEPSKEKNGSNVLENLSDKGYMVFALYREMADTTDKNILVPNILDLNRILRSMSRRFPRFSPESKEWIQNFELFGLNHNDFLQKLYKSYADLTSQLPSDLPTLGRKKEFPCKIGVVGEDWQKFITNICNSTNPLGKTDHSYTFLLSLRDKLIYFEFEVIEHDKFFVSDYFGIVFADSPPSEKKIRGLCPLFHREIQTSFYYDTQLVNPNLPNAFPKEALSQKLPLLLQEEFIEFLSIVARTDVSNFFFV